MKGTWSKWLQFFLKGVLEVSNNVIHASTRLQKVITDDRARLLEYDRATVASIKLLEELPLKPIIRMPEVCTRLSLSKPTAIKAINVLQAVGILVETTGKKKDKIYRYSGYLMILEEDVELKT